MSGVCASGTETNKIAVARKEYNCCECKRIIKKGDNYWYFAGHWQAGWQSFKHCLRCKNLFDLAIDKWPPDWDDEYPEFGGLYDWIREARR